MKKLRRHATSMRIAIEQTGRSNRGPGLSDFPISCSHHAVELIALQLSQLGWTDLHAAIGTRSKNFSNHHVWLHVDDVLIDITADQFAGEGQAPVIVAWQSPWHQQWNPVLLPVSWEKVINWHASHQSVCDGYHKIMATLKVVI